MLDWANSEPWFHIWVFDGFDNSPDFPHHQHRLFSITSASSPFGATKKEWDISPVHFSSPQFWVTHSHTTKSSCIFLPSKVQKPLFHVLELVRGREGSPTLIPTRPDLLPSRKIGAKGWGLLSFTLITSWQMKVLRPALPLSCSQHQLTSIQLTEISLLCCPSEIQSLFSNIHYLRAGSPTCHRL